MNLKQRFDVLDDNIKLSNAVRKEAQDVHNRLGDLVVDAGVAKRTRLQGSFARHTMLGPKLRDIDKVVELDDELWDALNCAGGPQKAISLIHDALAPHLPGTRFEVKKHALAITLPGKEFNFDAVPAFNPEDGSNWIYIADTEDDRWEPSNSYILIDTITVRNQQCDGKFVRQVRMVKQAVHNAGLSDVLPGLHVETFTYYAVSAAVDHADAVAATLAIGAQLLGGTYSDPTGTDQISARLSAAAVARAKSGMQHLAGRAAEAQRLAADGKETAAAHIWVEIFGDPFPHPRADEKSRLQSLNTGAGAAATGATAARHTPITRAWRP
ncbi:MAG: nucleotidyltransferase [bacterium]|nr:nucleotidyltransferase [bacterium]